MPFNRPPEMLKNIAFNYLVSKFLKEIDHKRCSQIIKLKWQTLINQLPYIFRVEFLNKILLNYKLPERTRIRTIKIIMNKSFTNFDFYYMLVKNSKGRDVLQILNDNCSQLEHLDLTCMYVKSQDRKLFETLLNSLENLKTIRLKCRSLDCAVSEILIGDNILYDDVNRDIYRNNCFNRYLKYCSTEIKRWIDPNVKPINIPLEKIIYLELCRMVPVLSCARILKALPNVTSLGYYDRVGQVLTELDQKMSLDLKLIYLRDYSTSVQTLLTIRRHCPRLQGIRLIHPKQRTVRCLYLIRHLTVLELTHFFCDEFFEYAQYYGRQIRYLRVISCKGIFDVNRLMDLCPNLHDLEMVDLRIEYTPSPIGVTYNKMRNFTAHRLFSLSDYGVKPLIKCFPNIETLDIQDRNFDDCDIEEIIKEKLWENLKSLTLNSSHVINTKLTIKSLNLILTHCKSLDEIKNISYFSIKADDLNKIKKQLKNCGVPSKLN